MQVSHNDTLKMALKSAEERRVAADKRCEKQSELRIAAEADVAHHKSECEQMGISLAKLEGELDLAKTAKTESDRQHSDAIKNAENEKNLALRKRRASQERMADHLMSAERGHRIDYSAEHDLKTEEEMARIRASYEARLDTLQKELMEQYENVQNEQVTSVVCNLRSRTDMMINSTIETNN
jgi:hypothetical protein